MTMLDLIVLLVALLVIRFFAVPVVSALIGALIVILVLRLVRGEKLTIP